MGNKYNVIEAASIKCACGGAVSLSSSATVERINGKKPLFVKDLIGSSVACPRDKNKCSVVSSTSMATTESNISSSGKYFLLRTDGCKTDKGRGVVLSSPGQGTSKIVKIPTVENLVVKEDEPLEKDIKEEKLIEHKTKYALYFLRKSEDIYKPLRPTRAFEKAKETFLSKDGTLDIEDNINVHTYAYIYIKQDNSIKEYKVISRGTLYNENIEEIFFENTTTKIKYNYIPIEKDTNIDISYSTIRLTDKKDIKKLKKISVNPKAPDQKENFYFKDSTGVNQTEVTKKELETQKKFKQDKEGKQKRLNILCIIEDILGEIEDMYMQYHTNYKLALAQNHTIIEDVKKNNAYTYTIANMVDIFYIDDKQKKEAQRLKEIYQDLVTHLLSDKTLIDILIKEENLANILNEENFKIAKSYVQEISYLNK
ncbi:MAG: hypothetical protein GY932_15860, partial [Arcobacter sp.]|nr:hypothetical protein [Arcobacter sp.]